MTELTGKCQVRVESAPMRQKSDYAANLLAGWPVSQYPGDAVNS